MKNINIFTLLLIIASLSLLFRLNDMNNKTYLNGIVTAEAIENVEDMPPELSTSGHGNDESPLAGDDYKSPHQGADFSSFSKNFSNTEVEVLQSLSKRRRDLEQREKQIITQEALLSVTEEKVEKKIQQLHSLRKELEDLLGKQSNIQESRMRSLVKIYGNMKPKDAARIMNTLEMDVLLNVLSRMSERKSAPIMANMDPERAREVTLEIAKQRNLPDSPP